MLWLRLVLVAVIAVCLGGCVGERTSAVPRDQVETLTFGGLARSYIVHIPPNRPTGVVLNLHGSGSTGRGQQALTNFDAVADANSFVVAYPDGYDKSWDDGRGASPADRQHVNDVGFLVALAVKLVTDFGVEPGHVFATGMSNGGFMANRLACDHAEIFAAIAPVAGTLGVNVGCVPSRPVAVLDVHGTADPVVPFKGGTMRGRGGMSTIISAPQLVERWRAEDGCHSDPVGEQLLGVGDGTVVHRMLSAPCAAGTAVVFYQVDGGGHTWPGAKQYLPKSLIGITTHVFDASPVIGQFFAAHARG